MATIVFAAVGSVIPGVGTALGAAVGSYIDQRYLFPAIFPPPKQESQLPKIDDLNLSTASEGSPMFRCFGGKNSVPGTVIWMGDLVTEPVFQKTSGGGGGCGGEESTYILTGYNYFIDIAIAACEGPIDRIPKVWADGKTLYDKRNDVSIASNQISGTASLRYSPSSTTLWTYNTLESPNGGPDLSQIRPGVSVTLAGFPAPTHIDGSKICVASWKENSGISYCILLIGTDESPGESVDFIAGPAVTITQILPDLDESRASNVTFYLGTAAQTADPLIEADKGAGEVPAFRNVAYVVFQRLLLGPFGNRIPTFTFLVEESLTRTVAETIGLLLESGGKITSADYDVSEVLV